MVFQQFGGINGIIFYADQIFASAGELTFIELCMYTHILSDLPILLKKLYFDLYSGVPPSTGSILYSGLQVLLTAFAATLIDKAGRRPLLMVGPLDKL